MVKVTLSYTFSYVLDFKVDLLLVRIVTDKDVDRALDHITDRILNERRRTLNESGFVRNDYFGHIIRLVFFEVIDQVDLNSCLQVASERVN